MNNVYERMVERYARGNLPWNDPLPPPEVQEIATVLPAGRALDLGCGFGRTAIYLATRGWEVDGIDFVPEAIAEARRRAGAANAHKARFHVAQVTGLEFLAGLYDLAVDVGCAHSLGEDALGTYWAALKRLLRPGAVFLWFVRLRGSAVNDEQDPRGIPLEWVRRLSADGFQLEREEVGTTENTDGTSWSSAWIWLKRL